MLSCKFKLALTVVVLNAEVVGMIESLSSITSQLFIKEENEIWRESE